MNRKSGSMGWFWKEHKPAAIFLFLCFLFLLFCAGNKKGRLTDNPRSRIITVERLVEAGTFAHRTPGDTTRFELSIDHIKIGEEIYSSKPPNYPMLMAMESMLMKWVSGWNFYDHRVDYLRMLVIVNQIIPYLAIVLLAFFWLAEFTSDKWTLYYMTAALSIGLLPFGYSVTINNHTIAAILYFLMFYQTWKITSDKSGSWYHYLLAGFSGGFAFTIEMHGGVFVAFFILLLARKNLWMTLWTMIGITIMIIPTLVVYHGITGSWSPIYTQGGLYRYEGSYWTDPKGFDAVKETKLTYAWMVLFGHHGLFTITPMLILPFIAFYKTIMNKAARFRFEFIGIMVGILVSVGFIIRNTWNYGGDCIGMRWFIFFMPILMFLSFPLIEKMGKSIALRLIAIILLLLSVPWNINAAFDEAFLPGWFYTYIWFPLFG